MVHFLALPYQRLMCIVFANRVQLVMTARRFDTS